MQNILKKINFSLFQKYLIIFSIIIISFLVWVSLNTSKYVSSYLEEEKVFLLDQISAWVLSVIESINQQEKEWFITEEEASYAIYQYMSNFKYWRSRENFLSVADLNGFIKIHPKDITIWMNIADLYDSKGYNYWYDILDQLKTRNYAYVKYQIQDPNDPNSLITKILKVTKVNFYWILFWAGLEITDIKDARNEILIKIAYISIFFIFITFSTLFISIYLWERVSKEKKEVEDDLYSIIKGIPVSIFRIELWKNNPPIIWNDELINLYEIPKDYFGSSNFDLWDFFYSKSQRDKFLKTISNNNVLRRRQIKMKTYKWKTIWVNLSWRVKSKNGKMFFDWAIENITDMHNVHIELKNSYMKLKKVDSLKDDIIWITSHELRNPLTIIKWFSSILYEEDLWKLNKEQKNYAKHILDNSDKLIELVWTMLDLSKLDSWKFILNMEKFDLVSFIKNIVEEFNLKMTEEKKVVFDSPWEKIYIENDEFQLKRVFINLIWNALKFVDNWEWIVKIEIEKKSDLELIVHIKDNWVWIEKEDLKDIFEKFKQVWGHMQRTHEWSWLGLAITKSLLDKMWSDIWVSSELWKWSDFYFNLKINNS